jgi:hypothetical protein
MYPMFDVVWELPVDAHLLCVSVKPPERHFDGVHIKFGSDNEVWTVLLYDPVKEILFLYQRVSRLETQIHYYINYNPGR